jgi:NADH-quinone oxidoreductase subunit E
MLETLGRVDTIISNHGNDRTRLIQILLDLQNEFRWLSREVLARVGKKLDVPTNHIYSLTTFYSHFSLVPRGRHTISVCMGTACHVRGAERLLDKVTSACGCKAGETTKDEKFSVSTVNCLGACALGPVMVAADEYMSNPTADEVRRKVESCE